VDDTTGTGKNSRQHTPERPRGAGKDSYNLVTELDRSMQVAKEAQRQYNNNGEKDR
jgi:hypothetical protein